MTRERSRASRAAGSGRSDLSSIPLENLRAIQIATMRYDWRGVICNKNPFDLALYQQLLGRLAPRTIVEIGYKLGGSSLWFADMASAHGLEARVVSLDILAREQVTDPRITFLQGDANRLESSPLPEVLASCEHPWLVVEDADHRYETTRAVLEFFAPRLTAGDYLVVEDGICSSMGNASRYNGGPLRAIREFHDNHPGMLELDTELCDTFGPNVTWAVNGWLRRSTLASTPSAAPPDRARR